MNGSGAAKASEEAPDELVGRVLNQKYRIVDAIGKGGMGAVYRAEQLPLGRSIALKVLHNSALGGQATDPAFQKRFLLEAQMCAKLSHPNIVTIFDYGRIDDLQGEAFFIAMELLHGPTLHQRLRQRGGMLTPEESVSVVIGMARGLREAHKHGVVHRDLKPGNVLLVEDEEQGERPKIVDFGLVKQLGNHEEEREDLTQQGTFLGSPKYMSPEQVEGGAIDHRTDIYSLGVIFYQCLCGKVPFDKGSAMQTLLAHVSDPVPPISERNPDAQVPLILEDLARRMLAKEPMERPVSIDELLRDLRTARELLGYRSSQLTTTGLHVAAGGFDAAAMGAGSTSTSVSGSLSQGPAASGLRPVSPPIAASAVPPEAPAPVVPAAEQPEGRKRAGVVLLLGSVALLGLVVGVGWELTHRAGTAATLAATTPPVGATTAPAPAAPALPTPAVPAVAALPAAPPVESNGTAAPAPPPELAPPEVAGNAREVPGRRPAPVRHAAAPAAVAVPAAPVPVAPVPATPPAAVEEMGFLSLDTTPYSTVTMDGRSLGTTPLMRVRLPVGAHLLTLSNPEEHLTMNYRVTIRAGETLVRRLGLQ